MSGRNWLRLTHSAHGSWAQQGIALIAVLWVLILLALLAANFTRTTRTGNLLARNLVANAEARALADAGIYRAVLGLLATAPADRVAVDGTTYRMQMPGGEVILSLQDEGGKIDLNRAPKAMLIGLFQAVELAEEEAATMVDTILDYRDRDNDRRANGAEDDDYRAAGVAFEAKDAPFEAIEELRQVLGMSGDLYRRVSPAITVYGRGRRVNQATAPPLVLRALPHLGDEKLSERLEERTTRSEKLVQLKTSTDQDANQDTTPDTTNTRQRRRRGAAAVTVRAEAKTTKGAVFIREAIVRTKIRRRRNRDTAVPFEILAWRVGERKIPETVSSDPDG